MEILIFTAIKLGCKKDRNDTDFEIEKSWHDLSFYSSLTLNVTSDPLCDLQPNQCLFGGGVSGHLCITRPWPGQARRMWNDGEQGMKSYYETFRGKRVKLRRLNLFMSSNLDTFLNRRL